MPAFTLYCGNAEPSIDELLGDPIVHALMKRDGVPPPEIDALIATARRRQHLGRDASARNWRRSSHAPVRAR